MKGIILITSFLTLLCYSSYSQQKQPIGTPKNMVEALGGLTGDSVLKLPTIKKTYPYFDSTGNIALVSGTLYVHNGTIWVPLTGSGTVTMVNSGYGLSGGPITGAGTLVADTATLFTKLASTFSAGYGLNFGGRTYKVDTAVLAAYIRSTIPASGTGTVTNVATSTGILGGPITTTGTLQIDSLIVPKWDDTLAGNYKLVTKTTLADTAAAIRSAIGSGSVTSVGTGYGLTGGPITSTGTIVADSATLFSQLIATLAAGYGLTLGSRTYKVDTATLASYIRSTISTPSWNTTMHVGDSTDQDLRVLNNITDVQTSTDGWIVFVGKNRVSGDHSGRVNIRDTVVTATGLYNASINLTTNLGKAFAHFVSGPSNLSSAVCNGVFVDADYTNNIGRVQIRTKNSNSFNTLDSNSLVRSDNSGFTSSLIISSVTGNRIIRTSDESGTIILTSDSVGASSNISGIFLTKYYGDTHYGAGSGTVTSVNVVPANGISGSVANPTTTPAITLTLGAITPGSVAATGTVTGSNLSGTNTGDQTITLTGDVTGSGTGSFAATIGANKVVTSYINANAVTYAKIQSESASTLLGNPTGSGAVPSEITLGSGLSFSGTTLVATGTGGTVTTFSSGNLSPIFTTSVATATTTPALTFALTNAAAHTFFGNFTGSSGAPSYSSPSLASADFANQGTTATLLHGNASGNPSFGSVVTADVASNAITYGKIQAASTNSILLGTPSSGTAYQEITLGTGLSMSSGTLSAMGTGGTVTSVASADGSITVTNPTTAVDLAVVKAPQLSTARTIGGVSFNGTANITVATATGGFTVSGGDLACGTNNITVTGSIGATGARVTKLWATDLTITNAPKFDAFTTNGGILYTNGSGTVAQTGAGTSTTVLHGGTSPAYGSVTTSDAPTLAPLASPTFTGTVTIPTPFTLGATSVTTTGTQINYLNAATGTTGTTSTNIVFSTSPVLTTPTVSTPVINGLATGTGVSSSGTSASTIKTTDANANLSANNVLVGVTSVATAAGTTTLTIGSTQSYLFTGTTTQTAVLPLTSSTTKGVVYYFTNTSTGAVTVQANGGTTLVVMAVNSSASFLDVGTAGASTDWQTNYQINNSLPAISGNGRVTAQTAAATAFSTATVGSSDASYWVSANINITTSTTYSFTVTCTYTDETNTSRSQTEAFMILAGTTINTISNVTAGVVPLEGVTFHIRCKAATTITWSSTGTFTAVTYNAEGIIQQEK